MALRSGFSELMAEELVLVASELGSNIVKHAGSGTITVRRVLEGQRSGLRIEAMDVGPGFVDEESAVLDGYSTTGTLGYGMGTVDRLMDDVVVSSTEGKGASVIATRWVRAPAELSTLHALDIGIATRAHPRMAGINGDAFVLCRHDAMTVVGIIDGLGHGQLAHDAAQTARRYVEAHCVSSLSEILCGCGRECRPTRGVVMAVARIDCRRNTLQLACVGNIEVRLHLSPEPLKYLPRRGIVGMGSPSIHVTEQAWSSSSTLCMFSDGVRSHWDRDELSGSEAVSASNLAGILLRRYAREDDDATVAVVKGRPV